MKQNQQRFDRGSLPTETELTEEGYIKAKVVVTRCGIFIYKNADGSMRKELRHPDEILNTDSLASMKMIPVVNDHPSEKLIDAENAKRLAVGYTGETVEEVYPYILANLVITDNKTVNEIKQKEKNELSLGYTCDLVEQAGMYHGEPYDCMQTNIRYNHLAVVKEARAGKEARIALDSAKIFEKERFIMSKKDDKKKKIKIDAQEYLVDNAVAHYMKKMTDEMTSMKEAHEKSMAQNDFLKENQKQPPSNAEEEGEMGKEEEEENRGFEMEDDKEEEKEDEIGANGKEEPDPVDMYGMESHVRDLEPPSKMENHVVEEPKNKKYPHDLPKITKVDSADVQKMVKNRVRLEKMAEKYLDKQTISRLDSLSDLDIKKKIIKSVQKNAELEGKSDVYINARFDSVVENLPKNKVIAIPTTHNDARRVELDQADATDARNRMIARMPNMYKNKSRG